MIRPILILPLLAALLGCSAEEGKPAEAAAPTPVASPKTPVSVDCTDDETILASCTVENGKQMAVCSSEAGQAQYRFGDETAEIAVDGGSFVRVAYAGGGELQMAFDNGDTRYVVFARTVRTGRTPIGESLTSNSDGVVVLTGGEFAGLQVCTSDSDGSFYNEEVEAAYEALPQAQDLFTDETYRADTIVRP